MSIVRRERRKKNFTIVDNAIFDDRNLSPDAMAILMFLLSKPDDWEVSLEHLRGHFTRRSEKGRRALGRDYIAAIMRELRSAGYAELVWLRDPVTREIKGSTYVIRDEPSPSEGRDTDNPLLGDQAAPETRVSRGPETPGPGKGVDLLRTESLPRTDSDQTPSPQPPQAIGPTFEAFAKAFECDDTMPLKPARKAFARLTAEEQRAAIIGAERNAKACREKRRQRLSPQVWLRQRGWETASSVAEQSNSGEADMAKTRGVWIADESPQGDAWRKYLRASGKGMPFMTDSALHKGRGYYRPSEWPPGYEARPSAAPVK